MHGTILLVDDNTAFIDSIRDILENESYEVVTAYSGEEACSLTEHRSFDMVLMDIKMPGMNGVDSFLRMKAQHPDIKVVLFTAYALEEMIQKAEKNGVVAVMKKPLVMDQLLAIIGESHKITLGGWVLIADDDRALCENLYDNLTQNGYRVALACDAMQALEQAQCRLFDIMLLDLKIPEMDGLEIYRRVKIVQPNLITILMTGYAEEMRDKIRQALQESAYAMVPKPIDMNYLLNMLAQVIEDRKKGVLKKPDMEHSR